MSDIPEEDEDWFDDLVIALEEMPFKTVAIVSSLEELGLNLSLYGFHSNVPVEDLMLGIFMFGKWKSSSLFSDSHEVNDGMKKFKVLIYNLARDFLNLSEESMCKVFKFIQRVHGEDLAFDVDAGRFLRTLGSLLKPKDDIPS